MTRDLLERSTRAFAAVTAERGSDAARLERTLRRMEQSRRVVPNRRQTLRTVYWTFAALCVGVGAWANATGRVSWFQSEAAAPEAAAPAPSAAERRRTTSSPSAQPAPSEPLPPPALEHPPAAPIAPRAAKKASRPIAVEPVPAPSSSLTAAPREGPRPILTADGAYREAHRAHFDQRDDSRALSAWDLYLELAEPGHPLLLEARFNRAITLYRLGRRDAARKALEPFASGDYGGYRREEARRLLEALGRGD
jgi:hypothetical protein